MEHFLVPRGATVAESDRAPYIADDYDQGPFLDYPLRSRFRELYALFYTNGEPGVYGTKVLSEEQKRQLEILLQTWLYFGLLYEIFGNRVSKDAFIEYDDRTSRYFLSTARLAEVAADWTATNSHADHRSSGRLEHLIECLLVTYRMCSLVRRDARMKANVVICNIAALGAALQTVVLGTFQSGRSLPALWGMFYDPPEMSNTMRRNGWCPADIEFWRSRVGTKLQLLYYLSKLEQPGLRNHTQCVGSRCLAHQYDMARDTALHRCEDGLCGMLYVDEQRMMDILAEGHIGLLAITLGDNSLAMSVDVVSSNVHPNYVAISHVWAEGLGNPVDNGLPRCQVAQVARSVARLQDRARSKHGQLLLWLDTLCCPVRSDRHRKMCLAKMGQIYRDAAYVLVLDAPLSQYSRADLDYVEIAARLKYSSWRKRLWTFQEGMQARRLWLSLKDDAIDLDEVQRELDKLVRSDLVHRGLLLYLSATHRENRTLVNWWSQSRGSVNIADVIRAVKERSVSVLADEPLCLSTCMRLDQERMMQAHPEERMATFWQSLERSKAEIPRGIIFFHSERLTQPSLCWAPASFLHQDQWRNLRKPATAQDVAKITSDGLCLELPGCRISLPNILPSSERPAWDDVFKHYSHAVFHLRLRSGIWLTMGRFGSPNVDKLSLLRQLRTYSGICDILAEPEFDDISQGSTTRGSCQGLLGIATSYREGRRMFHCESYVIIMRLNQTQSTGLEAAYGALHDERLRLLLVPSRKTPTEQSSWPDDPMLCHFPNDAVARLYELAEMALMDSIVRQSYGPRPYEAIRKDFVHQILVLFYERYGEIIEAWPSSQKWCVD